MEEETQNLEKMQVKVKGERETSELMAEGEREGECKRRRYNERK